MEKTSFSDAENPKRQIQRKAVEIVQRSKHSKVEKTQSKVTVVETSSNAVEQKEAKKQTATGNHRSYSNIMS